MKTISSLRDLERYGIVPLTGEADALSFRILCDLTRTGVLVVREALGLPKTGETQPQFAANWNDGTDSNPHVASIMLDSNIWHTLGIIALLEIEKCHTVCSFMNNYLHLIGFENDTEFKRGEWDLDKSPPVQVQPPMFKRQDDEDWIPMSEGLYGTLQRVFRKPINHTEPGGQRVHGTRNVHAMTGRSL
jgi:hypothetical protein